MATTWAEARRALRLPLRRPWWFLWSIAYAAAVYAPSQRAGLLDIDDPMWVVTVGVVLLLSPIYHAVLIPSISAAWRDAPSPWRSVLADAGRAFPQLVIGELLANAAVICGSILLIVPGIYIGVRFAFYKQAILLHRRAAVGSIQESYARIRTARGFATVLAVLAVFYSAGIGAESLLLLAAPSWFIHVGSVGLSGALLVWVNALLTAGYEIERAAGERAVGAEDSRGSG